MPQAKDLKKWQEHVQFQVWVCSLPIKERNGYLGRFFHLCTFSLFSPQVQEVITQLDCLGSWEESQIEV